MAYIEIYLKAYQLADELKKSYEYEELKQLNQLLEKKYHVEIENYQKAFQVFQRVLAEGGKYHPDFKEATTNYQEAKKELFEKSEVKKYFQCENRINDYLKELSDEIFKTVSCYYGIKGESCGWL
ncbi:MAG: hypothetical protein GX149_03280 [Acholeplasmataceae bacterium]|jgi:cell fate (sporulation/competence/biofilm development) regulator YlbF (YheA/YmcA/DUF963 family)|nr:hypothetical protein [Acholeplasmataceae bacterium]